MITTLSLERLSSSVMAVPPLCRNADFSISASQNARLIKHIEGGGVNTLLYGGNANFYHIPLSEFDEVLSCLEQQVAPDTLLIPSVSCLWGTMMDQARIVRKHKFPTIMILPMQGPVTSRGAEEGIRRFVDAAGIPALLYLKNDGYMDVPEVARLAESRVISGIKYAIVRPDAANDPYLRSLCDAVDKRLIISGMGEQPAIIHMRDFKLPGFTAGVINIAPAAFNHMLKSMRTHNWAEAEKVQLICKPLEDLRNEISPVRVLHEAVRLCGIAETGPLLPLLSNLDPADHPRVAAAAKALLAANRQFN